MLETHEVAKNRLLQLFQPSNFMKLDLQTLLRIWSFLQKTSRALILDQPKANSGKKEANIGMALKLDTRLVKEEWTTSTKK